MFSYFADSTWFSSSALESPSNVEGIPFLKKRPDVNGLLKEELGVRSGGSASPPIALYTCGPESLVISIVEFVKEQNYGKGLDLVFHVHKERFLF